MMRFAQGTGTSARSTYVMLVAAVKIHLLFVKLHQQLLILGLLLSLLNCLASQSNAQPLFLALRQAGIQTVQFKPANVVYE